MIGIEARPGVDVAALQREAAVGVLQQDELHVLLGELVLGERADEEDVRIGAAGHRDALALEVRDGLDGLSPLVTSAVHSGRE